MQLMTSFALVRASLGQQVAKPPQTPSETFNWGIVHGLTPLYLSGELNPPDRAPCSQHSTVINQTAEQYLKYCSWNVG